MNLDHHQSQGQQQDEQHQQPLLARAQQQQQTQHNNNNNDTNENIMNRHHYELQRQEEENGRREKQHQQELNKISNTNNHASDDDVVVDHHLDHRNNNNNEDDDIEYINSANDDEVFLDDNNVDNDNDDDDEDDDNDNDNNDNDDDDDDDYDYFYGGDIVDARTDIQKLHQLILNDNNEEFERFFLIVKERNTTTDDFDCNQIGSLLMSYCYFNRNIQMIQLLLNHGANVNIVHPQLGYTALHIAVRLNSDDTMNTLRYDRTMKLIPLLLQYGANVNATTTCENELSPLHLCAINPLCIDILKLLVSSSLSNDVNVNKQDIDGRTPLHYAIGAYNILAIQYLIVQHNIDIHIKDNVGYCPMRLAITMSLDSDDDDDDDADESNNTISDMKEKTIMIVHMMQLEHEKRIRHEIYKYLLQSSWITDTQQEEQLPKSNTDNNSNSDDDLKQRNILKEQPQQYERSSRKRKI